MTAPPDDTRGAGPYTIVRIGPKEWDVRKNNRLFATFKSRREAWICIEGHSGWALRKMCGDG